MQLFLEHQGSAPPDLTRACESEFTLVENFLRPAQAARLFDSLTASEAWRQDSIVLFGKSRLIPRKHRWFSTHGGSYRWSGLTMEAEAFPSEVETLRQALISKVGIEFNTALANLYRDGNDSVSWHADDEKELGPAPVIASVSLGATRRFVVRKKDKTQRSEPGGRRAFELGHGSLLLMGAGVQQTWEHALPKTKRVHSPRINLTFRVMQR